MGILTGRIIRKKEYSVGDVFSIGRGLFKVCHADRRYFYACTDCNLRNKKSCEQMRCKATERADGKDVVFVAL